MRKIIVGSRGSRLALIQTESVVTRIKEANPDLEIQITTIITAGDRDRRTPLDKIGVAVFVKELEEALLDGRIDLAVHSLKDVPTELPDDLCLLAVTERLDPRDALIAKARLSELPTGSRIGTDSLRRSVQLMQQRPDIEVCSIRGNVDTRLRKVDSGEVDGIITAAAALVRLCSSEKITEYLSLEHFLPPAGQGALVIEVRRDDREIANLVLPLNDLNIWRSTIAERSFVRSLGGGCRAPIAALGTINGATLKLEGMIASISKRSILRANEEGDASFPEELGVRLARRMLNLGASEYIAEVTRG